MKFIVILIIVLFTSSVHAELFKCEVSGATSYQEKPCKSGGSEFELKEDISKEQQNAAVSKLEKEISDTKEIKRIAKEEADKERLIQTQEEQVKASYENAIQSERQANALESEALDRNRNNRVYQTPYLNNFDHRILPHNKQINPALQNQTKSALQNHITPPHQNQTSLPRKNVIKLPDEKSIIQKKSMQTR
jgi:hypothetical protein